MILIDAYGLVALVAEEPAAAEVEELLREGGCRVVPVNLAEAVYTCQGVHSIPTAEIRSAIEPLMLSQTLAVAVSGEPEAWMAAELRVTHYDRKTCPLSLADCFLFAHAVLAGDGLATVDPDLARVARLEGIAVRDLPDRSGSRP